MEALQKLQIEAIVKQNGIENSQELGNKKITLRNHILNLDFICAYEKSLWYLVHSFWKVDEEAWHSRIQK